MDVEAQTSSSAAASSSAGGDKEAELFGRKRTLDAKMIAEEYKNMEKKHAVSIRPGVDTRTGVAVLNVRVFAVPAAEQGRLLQYSQTTFGHAYVDRRE